MKFPNNSKMVHLGDQKQTCYSNSLAVSKTGFSWGSGLSVTEEQRIRLGLQICFLRNVTNEPFEDIRSLTLLKLNACVHKFFFYKCVSKLKSVN